MSERLQVFVSSVMAAENLDAERESAMAAISSLHLTVPWAFEFAPAEPEPATNVYLREVTTSDLLVLVVSRTHSPAVQSELDEAERSSTPILAFVRRLEPNDPAAERREPVLRWLRERVKYREFTDLNELELAVRDSLINELVRGYRKFRLQRTDLVSIFNYAPDPPSLAVAQATAEDIEAIREILVRELSDWYPGIGKWANKMAEDAKLNPSEVRVAKVGGEISGVSVSREKDDGVRKFSTLYVRPGHRGEAIGPRLIYEEVRRAAQQGVRKAYVTFADELSPALFPLLSRYGFVAEGVSAGRYRPGVGEWVMGKSFVRGEVRAEDFPDFVKKHVISSQGGEVVTTEGDVWEVRLPKIPLLGLNTQLKTLVVTSTSPRPEEEYQACAGRFEHGTWVFISMYGKPADADHWSHSTLNWIDGEDLRSRFYPLEFVTPELKGVLCTIKPTYANALVPEVALPTLFAPERLQIRPDNVYYRTPDRFLGLRRGSPVLFYVSSPNKHIRGSARLREYRVSSPEELLEAYGTMGILDISAVQTIADHHSGKALALVFDWYHEHPIKLSTRSIANVITRFNPISATILTHAEATALVHSGTQD